MSNSNLTTNLRIDTNFTPEMITEIIINDRSPMQSPRAKSPTNIQPIKCPGAPKKIAVPVPRTPRVQNETICKQLFD